MTGELRVRNQLVFSILYSEGRNRAGAGHSQPRENGGGNCLELFSPTRYLFSEEPTQSGYRPSKTISHPLSSRLGKRTNGAAGWKEEDGIPTLLSLAFKLCGLRLSVEA